MNTNGISDQISKVVAENWKVLVSVVAAGLAVLAIVGAWNEYRARRDREATNVLYEAQTSAHALLEQKKLSEAEKAYQPVFDKFPNSRAAYEAELQIGDFWMDANDYARAIPHYEKAAQLAKDSFSRVLSHYTLGVAKESAGKHQEAITEYDAALQAQGSDFLKPEILMAQARCYEALNQGKKAIEIYKTVEERYASRAYYSGAASAFEKQLSAKQL